MLAAALLCTMILAGCGGAGPTPHSEKIIIAGRPFELELATDAATRQRGLMYRDHIPDQGGMLFVFPDSEVSVQNFWMGNCLIDMDIIYLDRAGYVTATHRMKAESLRGDDESEAEYDRRMPRYSSAYPAQFAIELQAGMLDQLKVSVEDKIDLDVGRLKAMAR